jgi:hypothetical protein
MIGNKLTGAPMVGDAPIAIYRRLYRALSDDVREAFPEGTPERKRWDELNRSSQTLHQRFEKIYQPLIESKTPERATALAFSGTQRGASAFREIIGSLTPEQGNVVRAYTIEEMGRAPPNAQGVAGDTFSMPQFLTRWNKLHPDAQRALFPNGKTRTDMDTILNAVARVKDAGRGTFNPSNTTGTLMATETFGQTVKNTINDVFHLNVGNAAARVGSTAAQMLVTKRLANAMTSPQFIHWLAEGTKTPQANSMAYLARLEVIARNTSNPEVKASIDDVHHTLLDAARKRAPVATP